MTIRDFQASFTDSASQAFTSIVGVAGTYLAPNSLDTSPLGAYLTENSAADTVLSPNVNTGRDLGGGTDIWLIIDWLTAPVGGTSVDMQLITSASSSLSSPVVLQDFTVIVIANLPAGTRQQIILPRSANYLQWLGLQAVTVGTMTGGTYVAWLGVNNDYAVGGYASGFSIK